MTDRQLEVTRLVAQGLENEQIAHELYMGLGTVKSHLSYAMKKLHAKNRAHLVYLAMQKGLIT